MSMIWMTEAHRLLQTSRPLALMSQGTTEPMPQAQAVALMDRIRYHQPIEDAEIPRRFYRTVKLNGVGDRKSWAAFPAMTNCGLTLINARARASLDRLNIGASSILPVEIYDTDGVSLLRDDISILVVRELKRTIDIDHSTAVAKAFPSSRFFTFDRFRPSNLGMVRLMPGACDGVDVWMDPLIGDRLFLSERGGDLFRSQGILKDLKAKPIYMGQDNQGPWG